MRATDYNQTSGQASALAEFAIAVDRIHAEFVANIRAQANTIVKLNRVRQALTNEAIAAAKAPAMERAVFDLDQLAEWDHLEPPVLWLSCRCAPKLHGAKNSTSLARLISPCEGLGQHAIRKILAGTYKRAKGLGVSKLQL